MNGGVTRSTKFFSLLTPTLKFVTPAQSVCNYATLLTRNAQSLLSIGDGVGTSQRFLVVSGGQIDSFVGVNAPNSENGPSSAPANSSPTVDSNNFLHANPYPYTASPGQPHVCAAGNEKYISESGRRREPAPAGDGNRGKRLMSLLRRKQHAAP